MNNELWSEVEEAYAKAAELPPEARIPFLKTAYANRPEIWTEVESLLQNQPAAEQLDQFCIMRAAAEMFADGDAEPIGTVVAGKYRIRERLGSGGMAEVYLADHLALNIPVALKRPKPALRSDREYRRTFLEEARRAVILDHENVARIKDVVDTNDEMFVVMEYIAGETLRKHLAAAERGFTIDKFLPLAIQCSSALAAAHEKRIVHLDVKPENIMLTPAGQVKICDFGVARRLPSTSSTATTVLDSTPEVVAGTPAYMAPEVILRLPFDERADLFSLGVVFYEMLTGSNPFFSDDVYATTRRVTSYNPPAISKLRPDIDPKLESLVNRMLSKDPNERYASAASVVKDLTALSRSRHRVEDIVISLKEAFRESRRMQVAALVVLSFLLIGTSAAWIYRQSLEQFFGLVPLPDKKTVVVLPFRVTGEKPSQHYVAGLTDVLTDRLSDMPELRVVSQNEVIDSGITTPKQGLGLFGANLAVTGSIHQLGETFQVVLSIADGKEGKQLRGKTLTMQGFNSLDAQTQIIEAVVGLLSVELKPGQQQALQAQGTKNPSAHELYLEGTGHLATRKPEDIDIAIGLFRDALASDSKFSLAYAGLGNAYRAKFQSQSRERQWADRAVDVCHQAVSLDQNLAAAHVCLGIAYNLRGDDELAIDEFELARQIDPTDDQVYRGLARSQEALNNLEAAEAIYLTAVKTKPDYWYNYVWLGNFYLTSRPQYREAIKWYNEAIARAPDNAVPYFGLCAAQFLLGVYEDAIKSCSSSVTLRPTDRAYINLGIAYFGVARYTEAAEAFTRAMDLNPVYYKPVGHLARTYYWEGRRNEAEGLFRKAIDLAQQELAINPGSASVHVMLARYHAMILNRSAALTHLHIALQKRPKEAEYQCIAAVVHNQFGERSEALRYLENAVNFGYSLAEISAERELDNLREDPRFRALMAGTARR